MSSRKTTLFYALLLAVASLAVGMVIASRLDLSPPHRRRPCRATHEQRAADRRCGRADVPQRRQGGFAGGR